MRHDMQPNTIFARNMISSQQAIFAIGILILVSSSIGLLLNSLSLPFYLTRRRYLLLSNMLYTCIITNDILTCLSLLPTGICFVHNYDPMWLRNSVVCGVTGFTFNITARMSVFLIAVLSVVRSISILLPFRIIKARHVISTICVYLVLNIVLALLPILFSDEGYFLIDPTSASNNHMGFCSWGLEKLKFVPSTDHILYKTLIYVTIIIPWLIPGLVVIISCIISIKGLQFSKKMSSRTRKTPNRESMRMPTVRNQINNQAKITILIITLVYITFNMPCWMYYLVALYARRNPVYWLRSEAAMYVVIFVSVLSVVMNASINPIIYISRTKQLQLFLRGKEPDLRQRSYRLVGTKSIQGSFTK